MWGSQSSRFTLNLNALVFEPTPIEVYLGGREYVAEYYSWCDNLWRVNSRSCVHTSGAILFCFVFFIFFLFLSLTFFLFLFSLSFFLFLSFSFISFFPFLFFSFILPLSFFLFLLSFCLSLSLSLSSLSCSLSLFLPLSFFFSLSFFLSFFLLCLFIYFFEEGATWSYCYCITKLCVELATFNISNTRKSTPD